MTGLWVLCGAMILIPAFIAEGLASWRPLSLREHKARAVIGFGSAGIFLAGLALGVMLLIGAMLD